MVNKELINSKKTTFSDFHTVLTTDWAWSEGIKIHITNNQQFAYLTSKIQFAFKNFTDVAIGRSKLIYSKKEKPISRDNMARSRAVFNEVDKNTLDEIKKTLNQKQLDAIKIAKESIKILKKIHILK